MRTVPRNFISLFASDVASRLLGFVATVYIARMLGAQGLGLLSYGMAFLTYALLFANPGLTTIGAREIAKDPGKRRIIEDILGLRFVLTVIVFTLFTLGVYLIPGQQATKTVVLSYLVSLFPLILVLEFVFQGRQEMHYVGISRLLQYSIYVFLLLIFLKSRLDIFDVPIYFFFGYVVTALFLIIVFFIKYKSLCLRFSLNAWRKLFAMAMPIGLATIFNQVALNLPVLALGILHSKVEVGFYSAGFKIVAMLLIIERVFYFVFFPVISQQYAEAFFPVISQQYAEAPKKLNRSFAFLTRLLFAITIPCAVCGIVLADKIIFFIYGAEFSGSILVFQMLLLYFLITPVNTIFGYGLVAIDQQRKFFKVITYTALVTGAAVALLCSETAGIILMNRELKRHVKFSSIGQVIKPIIASVITGFIVYVLRQWHVVVLVFVAVGIYVPVFYLIRGFSKKELKDLKQVFTRK
jgi:O-antigen/teichoic acid export membrane protein